MNILRIILAVLLPPVGVFLTVGIGTQFWINILLTTLTKENLSRGPTRFACDVGQNGEIENFSVA